MNFVRRFLGGTLTALTLLVSADTPLAQSTTSNPTQSQRTITLDPSVLPVVEKQLDNGLRILFLEDHSVPSVTYWTFFRVGSRNEREGITGLSHLFEHMMFNGAKKYGPKAFDKTLENAGGSSNAYTSQDITAYYEDFPPEALETVIDLESDRLRSLTMTAATLEPERRVVMEERRLGTDDDPFGALEEELFKKAFDKHPYHWPIVGWMKDLQAIKVSDAQKYFKTYYGPNNATVLVVGDFNTETVFSLLQKYYADIPKQPEPPKVSVVEPPQKAEKRVSISRDVQSTSLMVAYKSPASMSTPGVVNPEVPVFDVLQKILSGGESSRLYRRLVYEKELCTDVEAIFLWTLDPGLFNISVTLAPGVTVASVEAEIQAILNELTQSGPSEAELEKAKTQLLVGLFGQLSTNNQRGDTVGNFEIFFGSYKTIFSMPTLYQAVRSTDVQDVLKKYFVPTQKTVAVLTPKKGGGQ